MRSTAQDLRQWQTVIISSMQDLQTDRESTSEITFSSLAGKDIVIETENKIPVTTNSSKKVRLFGAVRCYGDFLLFSSIFSLSAQLNFSL